MAESTLGLLFEIGADPSKAIGAVGSFRSQFDSAISDIERTAIEKFTKVTGISKEFAIGMGVAGGAAVALGATLFELADKAAEAGGEIFEAAEKTGLSAESLSGLNAIAKLNGESFDGLTLAIARASRNLAALAAEGKGPAFEMFASLMGGAQNFERLGLLPLDQRIQTVIQRIFALNDVGERNRALQALLGRGWIQNVSTLQFLAEQGFGPAIEKARTLGLLFDEQSSRQARQFEIAWKNLQAQMSSVALVIGSKVLPAVLESIKSFSAFIVTIARGTSVLSAFKDAVLFLFEGMNNLLGRVSESWKKQAEASNAAIDKIIAGSKFFQDWNKVATEQDKIVQQLTAHMKDLAGDEGGGGVSGAGATGPAAPSGRSGGKGIAGVNRQVQRHVELIRAAIPAELQFAASIRQVAAAVGELNTRQGDWIDLNEQQTVSTTQQSTAQQTYGQVFEAVTESTIQALQQRGKVSQAIIVGESLMKAAFEAAEAIAAAARLDFRAAALHSASAAKFGLTAAMSITGGGGGGRSAGIAPTASGGAGGSSPSSGPPALAPGAVSAQQGGTLKVVVISSEAGAADALLGVLNPAIRYRGAQLVASHAADGTRL